MSDFETFCAYFALTIKTKELYIMFDRKQYKNSAIMMHSTDASISACSFYAFGKERDTDNIYLDRIKTPEC